MFPQHGQRGRTKPVIVEYKGRPRSKPTASFASDYNQDDHFNADERPPRDIGFDDQPDDSAYERALRSADALFGKPDMPPTPLHDAIQAPPAYSAPQPVFAPPAPVLEKFAEAESFFKKPSEPETDQPSAAEPAAPQPRILQDLTQTDPVEERMAAMPRRGRKLGSKNKPKPGAIDVLQNSPEIDANDVPLAAAGTSPGPLDEIGTPKKRGRPFGSKNKPKDIEAASDTVLVVPKKRGRPFGSTNKPKVDQPTLFDHAAVSAPRRILVQNPPVRVTEKVLPIARPQVLVAPDHRKIDRSIPFHLRRKPGEAWKARLRFIKK